MVPWYLNLFVGGAIAQQSFSTPNWQGLFSAGSGVLQSLKPASTPDFDFSPSDFFSQRNGSGNYHTGDFVLRYRQKGASNWTTFDTAQSRSVSPVQSKHSGSLLHSSFSNVDPTLAKYLTVSRDWLKEGSDLVLQMTLAVPRNSSTVEIGSFGFPIEFNSIFSNRTADDVTAKCSLIDPYIGLQAGYVQVTRLTGTGPNLVVTPYGNSSKFEGWRFLQEYNGAPFYYQSTTFEGFYSLEMLTEAYAENEWASTKPWNTPTSVTLQPGQSVQFGLRFTPSQNVYDIESTVTSVGRPVAVGLPGYVIPSGVNGQLFLKHTSAVSSITVSPSGALTFTPSSAPNKAWTAYTVTAGSNSFGRTLVTVKYADGLTQTLHYFTTTSQTETASRLSDFHFTNSYYTNTSDPFHRYGIVTYDYIANQMVLQDDRVWIAGQADEAGSVYEGISLKESALPDANHIAQLEDMVAHSIWGNLQNKDDFSVKRSLFFYDPSAVPGYPYSPDINYSGSWSKSDAYATWRAYDYVHCSSIYYSLYRASRVSPNILKKQTPLWYLTQAYSTVVASQNNTAYADVGLMGETMWRHLLSDLQAENLTTQATKLTSIMQSRQHLWSTQSDPYGSEMPWDSTGEEGVYIWSRYFNDTATVTKTLNYIRGYMPTVPHWGWNGNARRYWDFLYGGKLPRVERMLHHYGSTLNALPLLDNYKYTPQPASPAAFYDLRVGFGGLMGPLSNINPKGQTSTAFHSFPETMIWDGYSGDYGPTFLGHILGSVVVLVQHADFGWVAMGGNLNSTSSSSVAVTPYDTVQRNLYVADMGLAVQFDAGRVESFVYAPGSKTVKVNLVKGSGGQTATQTVMTFQDTLGKGVKLQTGGLKQGKGGLVVGLPGSVSFSL